VKRPTQITEFNLINHHVHAPRNFFSIKISYHDCTVKPQIPLKRLMLDFSSHLVNLNPPRSYNRLQAHIRSASIQSSNQQPEDRVKS